MTDFPLSEFPRTDEAYDALLADPHPLLASTLVPRPGMSRCARVLLTQEARVFLKVDCPIRLHLLIPTVPQPIDVAPSQIVTPPIGQLLPVQLFFDIDVEPAEIGPNRMPYISMPSPFQNPYPFHLATGQWIIGAVAGPATQIGIIVERLFSEHEGA